MKKLWSTAFAAALSAATLTAVSVHAQLPGVSSLIPDKATLHEQAKKLLAELTKIKKDPKVSRAEKSKGDNLTPQPTAVNTELAKPQVEPSKLTKLAAQLGDLQKQVAAIKR